MTAFIAPWSATVRERTLVVAFPAPYEVLSWAPLGGGFARARTILNHQVRTEEYPTQAPDAFLRELARRLQATDPVVGLMTGVLMERLVRKTAQRRETLLECFTTVGLSNALAVGDPATYEEKPGTINVIVALNQPLSPAALVEAIGIVTEAKTQVLLDAHVKSTVSAARATGTGTDCVAIACPLGPRFHQYCGKHTALGELLGGLVSEAIAEGVRRALAT